MSELKRFDISEISKKVDLHVKFVKFEMPNPFMLSSAPPTTTGEMIMRAFEAGWGGAVTKTIVPDKTYVFDYANRFGSLKLGDNIIAFQNIEEVSKRTQDEWEADVKEIKKRFPDRLLVGSLMAEADPEEWAKLARWADEAGFDMIELNFGCPHGMPERGMGAFVGQRADLTEEFTKAVVKEVSIPVMVKMTPNVTDIAYVAEAAVKGGADAISAINTVLGIIGIDIDKMEPLPSVGGLSTPGGISGPAVKPIGLRCVADIAKTVKVPISAIGGISTWRDAVEYMLVGATTLQVCTAVMLKGYRIVKELMAGLANYLYDKGFSSPAEIVGKALPKITTWHDIYKVGWVAPGPVVPKIDYDKCIRCGLCHVVCQDAGYQAMQWDPEERKPEVDEEKCDACSLCMQVCPVPGCITWTERTKPWQPKIKGEFKPH